MPPSTPLYAVAIAVNGDMTEGDDLHQFMEGPPVTLKDPKETIIVNAVKDIVQKQRQGLRFNAPSGGFVRVDASIWIGHPGAPLGWSSECINEWLQVHAGSLQHVGHPALCKGCQGAPPTTTVDSPTGDAARKTPARRGRASTGGKELESRAGVTKHVQKKVNTAFANLLKAEPGGKAGVHELLPRMIGDVVSTEAPQPDLASGLNATLLHSSDEPML